MKKPVVIEQFADNGGHSHWELIDPDTGEIIWSEAKLVANLTNNQDQLLRDTQEQLKILRDTQEQLKTAKFLLMD